MKYNNSILEKYPDYKMDIGMEVHLQLNTKSKIFCSCAAAFSLDQNKNICQICVGYPGVLPVLNKEVVTAAIMAGLSTNCTIAKISNFDRKHYFYPDLPKNYQITQNYNPICKEGYLVIKLADYTKKIRINRIHIEEDAGRNIHANVDNSSFVDLNRAGTPLLEIVSEADLESAEEVKAYLKELKNIMEYLGISNCNMEKGSFRADTNLSVRRKTDKNFGVRVELKNINSFKFIYDAIEYEFERHIKKLEANEKITQETRLWDENLKQTKSMRSKEDCADYRYFTDPDLAAIEIDEKQLSEIKKNLPELPAVKFNRYVKTLHLSEYEAEIIVSDINISNYFEAMLAIYNSKTAVNWLLRDLLGFIKANKIKIFECKCTPEKLAELAKYLDSNLINNKAAKEVFDSIVLNGGSVAEIIKEKGLELIDSKEELEKVVVEVLEKNSKQVAEYKAGNINLIGFFVGSCMKLSAGKGDPKVFLNLLQQRLK